MTLIIITSKQARILFSMDHVLFYFLLLQYLSAEIILLTLLLISCLSSLPDLSTYNCNILRTQYIFVEWLGAFIYSEKMKEEWLKIFTWRLWIIFTFQLSWYKDIFLSYLILPFQGLLSSAACYLICEKHCFMYFFSCMWLFKTKE